MKSAKLEWSLNDLDAALTLLDEAIKVFPDFPKLWMMYGQIYEQKSDLSQAFEAYNSGVSSHSPDTEKNALKCFLQTPD